VRVPLHVRCRGGKGKGKLWYYPSVLNGSRMDTEKGKEASPPSGLWEVFTLLPNGGGRGGGS